MSQLQTAPRLLLHPSTTSSLRKASSQPRQSFLITGAPGIGKYEVALALANSIVEDAGSGKLIEIKPGDMGNISIDAVKDIKKHIQFKSSSEADRKIIIMHDAHTMSTEAQNSFLKLLEEPPADVLIILLAWQPNLLLATIRSRVLEIEVRTPTLEQALEHFTDYDRAEVSKFYLMSGGSPVLIQQLLESDDHEYLDDINRAKTLISSKPYDRLAHMDDYSKDKAALDNTLAAVIQVLSIAMRASAKSGRNVDSLIEKIELTSVIRANIRKNYNTKLNLCLLFTSL